MADVRNTAQPGSLDQDDLLDLLNEVRRISAVLDPAANRLPRIELGKVASEVMPNPLASMAELPDPAPRPLPPGQSWPSLFDQFGRRILILGALGSGKTTSLLELARDLIARSASDGSQRIPIVLNLATWRGEDLGTWLAQEVTQRYDVRSGQGALRDRRLILLLDGLDEVSEPRRLGCVEAINAFLDDIRPDVAVCSREEDYRSLPVRLKVNTSISLLPLTDAQITQYLADGGHQLDALCVAIDSDDQLQDLARSPLMLNVMSLAYNKLSVDDLTANLGTVQGRRRHLFTSYVNRRLAKQKEAAAPYPPERVVPLLSWLARQMRERAESKFLIERLQPDWLKAAAERRAYIMTSRMLCGAALGLAGGGVLKVTLNTIEGEPGSLLSETTSLLACLGLGLLFGLANGIVIGLMDIWRFERRRPLLASIHNGVISPLIMEVAGYVLVLVLLNWLLISMVLRAPASTEGLMVGVLIALVFGLFFGIRGGWRGMSNDIRTVEALHWSWQGLRRSAVKGLVVGGVVGLTMGIPVWLAGNPSGERLPAAVWLTAALLTGLLGAALGFIMGAVFGGVESRITGENPTPNEGIWLSARNAVRVGVATAAIVTVVLGAVLVWLISLAEAVKPALLGGLSIGMLASLWSGGLDVLQHYILRVFLKARGYAPLRYARFLDFAASLIFLQKAGGGYLFVHSLLLEHFADNDGPGGPTPARPQAMAGLIRS